MNAILIWCEIPETFTTYYIPDAPEWLLDCHDVYINVDDLPGDHPIYRVNDALGKPEVASDPEWGGKWLDFRVKDPRVIFESPLSEILVINCGFVL